MTKKVWLALFITIKAICKILTANITLNGGKQRFSSIVRNKTGMLTVITLFNIIVELLTTAMRKDKGIKDI